MDRTSSPYHHGDLANALVVAAIELIDEHGVDAFSLRATARRVGVTPSASYRHFADKEALLATVAAQGFARLAEAMESAVDAVPPHEAPSMRARHELEALGVSYVVFAVRRPAQFRVMYGPHGAGSRRAPRGTGPSGLDPYELLRRGLDRLVAAGTMTSDVRDGAEVALWSTVHGYASLVIDGPLHREPSAADHGAIASLVAASIEGLLARSAVRVRTDEAMRS